MANNERVLASEMSIEAARETALDSVAVAADQHTAGRTTHISVSEAAQDRRLYRLFLVIGDGLILFLAFTLAYWLRFEMGIALESDVIPLASDYLQLTLSLIAVWLVLFALMGLYDFHNLLGGVTEYIRVANAGTVGMFSVVLFSFVNPHFVVARAWVVLAWVLSIVMVTGYRLLMRRLAYRSRTAISCCRR